MQKGGLPVVVLMVPDDREPARPFLQMLSYMSAGSYTVCIQWLSFLLSGFFFLSIYQIEDALDNESSRTLFWLPFFFLILTKSLVRLLG